MIQKFQFPSHSWLVAAFLALAAFSASADTRYWDGSGIWTDVGSWGEVSGGPYTETWAAGDDAVFNVAGSTITGANILFSSITANANVTVAKGGTLQPYFTADITVATGKIFTLGGQNNNTGQVLGGIGGIRKLGAGELVFGNAMNTYQGGFTIDAGTVSIWNSSAFGQGGPLTFNGGTIQSAGGSQDMSGKLSDITIGGDFGLNGNGGGFTFDADTFLGDAMRAINVGNYHSFNGKISGEPGGGIIKNGGGGLDLGGDNDFTGPVIINNGSLRPTHNNALGTTDGDTTINGGGGAPQPDFEFLTPTLSFFRASTGLTVAENLNFRASASGLCTLLNTNSGIDPTPRDHTLTGAIDVTSEVNSVNFTSESTGSFTFTGNITGTMTFGSNLQLRGSSANTLNRVLGSLNLTGGDLIKTGNGFWLVGAAGAGKTYSWNNTRMANGTLTLGLANILPPAGLLIMGNTKAGTFGGSGGVLDLNGFDQTVAGITYVGGLDEGIIGWTSGTRRITSATPAVLTVNNASDFSPTGVTPSTSVILQGALGLNKEGVGKLTLSGANTNTGAYTVANGTLRFARQESLYNNADASWSAANLNVRNGGTLAFNVGGTDEFTTGDVTTLLTNLAASSSATHGMNAGSSLGFDTTNASGGTFTIADVIANTGGASGGGRGLTKSGSGTLVLTNTNIYTGNTLVSAGTLDLADNAQLKFVLGASSGVNNSLTGTGTVTLTGDFNIDTSSADALASGRWTLENVSTATYIPGDSGFTVIGFSDVGSDKWEKALSPTKKYTFNEATGILTLSSNSAFDTWAADKGLTGAPGFENDPADDPDNDGRNNLSEFAFDGNPLLGASDGKIVGKVATVSSAPFLTLTLPVRNGASFAPDSGDQLAGLIDGIYYRVEGGTDLVTFADTITEVTGEDATNIQTGLPTLSAPDWTYRTFRVSGTVPTTPKNFMRVGISAAP